MARGCFTRKARSISMLPVEELIQRGFGGARLPDGCAMFGGTFAAIGGIRPASRFEFELEDRC